MTKVKRVVCSFSNECHSHSKKSKTCLSFFEQNRMISSLVLFFFSTSRNACLPIWASFPLYSNSSEIYSLLLLFFLLPEMRAEQFERVSLFTQIRASFSLYSNLSEFYSLLKFNQVSLFTEIRANLIFLLKFEKVFRK